MIKSCGTTFTSVLVFGEVVWFARNTRFTNFGPNFQNNFFPRGNLDSLGKNDPENRKNNDLTNFPAENQRVFTFRTSYPIYIRLPPRLPYVRARVRGG